MGVYPKVGKKIPLYIFPCDVMREERILKSAIVQVCKRNAKIHLYAATRRNIFFYKETNIRFI